MRVGGAHPSPVTLSTSIQQSCCVRSSWEGTNTLFLLYSCMYSVLCPLEATWHLIKKISSFDLVKAIMNFLFFHRVNARVTVFGPSCLYKVIPPLWIRCSQSLTSLAAAYPKVSTYGLCLPDLSFAGILICFRSSLVTFRSYTVKKG